MKKDWKENWRVDFIDWGPRPTMRAILQHNRRTAICYEDHGKFFVSIDYKEPREFMWPTIARRYAIRVLAASKDDVKVILEEGKDDKPRRSAEFGYDWKGRSKEGSSKEEDRES